MAQREFVTHPLTVRRIEVARVVDVTPRMRRVTLRGEQLAAFVKNDLPLPGFTSDGFDDHVKLIFATDGDVEAVLPVQHAYSIDWFEAPTREMRDYTPRRWDAEAGELDLDFVRHGDGPAATWAERAEPGSTVHIVGPKSSLVFPDDVDWVLLAGDETALPAIGRFLDQRPLDVPVQVIVEIRHPDARQDLPVREGDLITWLDTEPGAPSGLADAVTGIPWWEGSVYAWAAGESSALLPIRRWLSRDRKVPKTHTNVTGYWHDRPTDDAETSPAAEGGAQSLPIDDLLSPVPWFTTRAALDLGILDALFDDARPAADLAAALGLSESKMMPLVDYLTAIGVVERADDGLLSLGSVGVAILDDDHLRESLEDTLEARALLALASLSEGLRSDTGAFEAAHGRTAFDEVRADGRRFEELIAGSGGLDFVAGGAKELVADAAAITLVGPGSVAVADIVPDAAAVSVVDAAAVPLSALRAAMRRESVRFAESIGDTDVVVAANALFYRTDAQSTDLLIEIGTKADRLIVIEEFPPPAFDDHTTEHRLLDMAISGRPRRTVDDVLAVAHASGWTHASTLPLGWEYEALEFRRA